MMQMTKIEIYHITAKVRLIHGNLILYEKKENEQMA